MSVQGGAAVSTAGFVNVDIDNVFLDDTSGPTFTLWAGQGRYGFLDLSGGVIDADFVMGPSWPNNPSGVSLFGGTIGTAYIEASVGLLIYADVQVGSAARTGVVWGPGLVDVLANASLAYPSSATASSTFLQTGGMFVNAPGIGAIEGTDTSPSTACAVDPVGSGGWTCGIPLTPANLDEPVRLGGFGGDAVVPGGGSITDLGAL